jgi:hypothetical protein
VDLGTWGLFPPVFQKAVWVMDYSNGYDVYHYQNIIIITTRLSCYRKVNLICMGCARYMLRHLQFCFPLSVSPFCGFQRWLP